MLLFSIHLLAQSCGMEEDRARHNGRYIQQRSTFKNQAADPPVWSRAEKRSTGYLGAVPWREEAPEITRPACLRNGA